MLGQGAPTSTQPGVGGTAQELELHSSPLRHQPWEVLVGVGGGGLGGT